MSVRRTFFTHWLPPILWMTLIFIGSTGLLSAAHTSRFVIPFLRWLLGGSFTESKADFAHFLIRKAGHFTEYAILCRLFWRALGSWHPLAVPARAFWRFTAAVLLAAVYAASDEFHQSFIPSRTASFTDVLIDTGGAALGLLVSLVLAKAIRRSRLASPVNGEMPSKTEN